MLFGFFVDVVVFHTHCSDSVPTVEFHSRQIVTFALYIVSTKFYKMPCLDELDEWNKLISCFLIQHSSSLLHEGVTIDNLVSVHYQPFHFAQIPCSKFVCFSIWLDVASLTIFALLLMLVTTIGFMCWKRNHISPILRYNFTNSEITQLLQFVLKQQL